MGRLNITTRDLATPWMQGRRRNLSLGLQQHAEPTRRHSHATGREMSAFVLEDGVVYHTYSTYARGVDGLWVAYQWLDRSPKGRNEAGVWWRRHDEYDKA